MKRALALLVLVLLATLAACANLPEPQTLTSPQVASVRQYKVYVPLVYTTNPLGIAGCVPSCGPLGCSWCYSWGPRPGVGKDHERVPMIWGREHVGVQINGNSKWLLGFNEPDLPEQANMSMSEAVALWHAVEKLYSDRKLVSPAPSHFHPGWLADFRNAYRATYGTWPRFDALAMHCYWTADSCIEIGRQFVAWARAWNVPEVWVTEFAFVPAWAPNGDAQAEAQRWLAWLATQPTVTRYAPFISYLKGGEWFWPDTRPEANPSLFKADRRTLTPIGKWYVRPTLEPW